MRSKSWGAIVFGVVMATILGALVVAGPARAAGLTFYVDNTNPSCSDAGTGSATQPFCTITRGAAIADQGDTVQVVAGTYTGPVKPATSGAAGSPITFSAGPSVLISGGTNGFAISSKSYLVVRGFRVTGTSSVGITVSGSNNITLAGNIVTFSGQPNSTTQSVGIKLSNVTASTVAGNAADHNSKGLRQNYAAVVRVLGPAML